jgi:hypothetical protein
MKIRIAVLFAIVLVSTNVFAQNSPSDSKHQKIVELVRMTGTPQQMVAAMRQQIQLVKKTLPLPPEAQDEFETEFLSAVKVDDLVDLVVPAYEKYYTGAEIDQLVAFYQSPLGKKVVAGLPAMSEQIAAAGRELGAKVGAQIGAKIDAKLKAGEYGPWPPK